MSRNRTENKGLIKRWEESGLLDGIESMVTSSMAEMMESKATNTFKFDYTELKDNVEVTNTLIIETKDIVRSIGKFGESRQLVKLDVKKLNK